LYRPLKRYRNERVTIEIFRALYASKTGHTRIVKRRPAHDMPRVYTPGDPVWPVVIAGDFPEYWKPPI